MTLSALTNPAPRISEIDYNLSWDRLRDFRVPPRRIMQEARAMLRDGLTNQEAVHLFYQLGGVINASKLYTVPADRFALRNFILDCATAWLTQDFNPTAPFPTKTIGKLYAAFNHVGARLPKKIHKFIRDKVRDDAEAFLPKDGGRILEYYASTADSISPSVFEVAVKAVERDTEEMLKSRQIGFLNHMAIFDAMYGEGYFTKGYEPKSVFLRNKDRFANGNIAIEMGRVDMSGRWFTGESIPLSGNGLNHIKHVQETARRLEAIGLDVYSDFNCSATGDDTNGIDFTVGHSKDGKRVGVIYDTSVKYVEANTFPRTLFPSGRTIFNSAVVQRAHPDRVVVRLSTIAMNSFETEVIARVFEDAFRVPANVYGLNERAQLQPIRQLSFKT